jgi:hypothetical protein
LTKRRSDEGFHEEHVRTDWRSAGKKSTKAGSPPPAAGASASATDNAPAPAAAAVTAAPPPAATDAPAETADAATTTPTPTPAGPRSDDETDVTENSGQRYYFIGLRYRGQVIPQAFMDIFVNGGATVYSNSIGVELDMRKDGFSLIPNITYTSYGTGNMLFLQQGKNDPTDEADVGNWSMVNSSLGVIFLGTDFLWSVKLSKMFDFEYGLGFGIGIVFGNLVDNWVQQGKQGQSFTLNGQPGTALNGSVAGYPGHYYVPCEGVSVPAAKAGTAPAGCNDGDHMDANTTTPKINNFTEPHGFNPVPTLFFNVTIPQVGVRIKPIKSFEGRVGMGFNIPNGFMFYFSGDYGLEKLLEKK